MDSINIIPISINAYNDYVQVTIQDILNNAITFTAHNIAGSDSVSDIDFKYIDLHDLLF